jgi:oligo-1,6-glucosidase/alpha-glucosidase
MTHNLKWWQKTSIYQIYPRSYKDSNQDGIGDLKGIISKLDYIQDLGFETIWISPFFTSPMRDGGYDVSDYYSVAVEYGEFSDLEELINQVHMRNMRILFDLVLNHTSDQHPWFQESRSNLGNSKRDWYIWRNGKGRRPPNNWKSITGGSGWNYDEMTDQWYYATFLPFQPDLNYRNPDVEKAMFDVARFWLDKGIDGFRLDMFHALFKEARFKDNPWSTHLIPHDFSAGYFQEWRYNLNQPETVRFARELRKLANSYHPEKLLIGEIFGSDMILKDFLGQNIDGLNLVFSWDLMEKKINARSLYRIIQHYELVYPEPYTPVYTFGNHDRQRLFSRINQAEKIAPLLALFQLTVRGVPVVYNGEEIGMADIDIPAASSKDPVGQRFKWVPRFITNWLNLYPNRDGCRSPMQWDDSVHAGFSDGMTTPWLPVHQNYELVNVAFQQKIPTSLLSIYKNLLQIRNKSEVLLQGSLELIKPTGCSDQLLVYMRKKESQEILIIINFGETQCKFTNKTSCNRLIFQTAQHEFASVVDLTIHPYSGLILSS